MSALATAACPRCGAFAPMIPIPLGYPSMELFEASARGEVALGGCLVRGEDLTHRCGACRQNVIIDVLATMAATCATCGLPLDGDLDEEPDGDAGLTICGDCRRNREFAAIEDVVLWGEAVE